MKTLLLSAAALALLAGCGLIPQRTPVASETEVALCDAWQDSLATRSRSDTEQTFAEIGRSYDVFEATCQRSAF